MYLKRCAKTYRIILLIIFYEISNDHDSSNLVPWAYIPGVLYYYFIAFQKLLFDFSIDKYGYILWQSLFVVTAYDHISGIGLSHF